MKKKRYEMIKNPYSTYCKEKESIDCIFNREERKGRYTCYRYIPACTIGCKIKDLGEKRKECKQNYVNHPMLRELIVYVDEKIQHLNIREIAKKEAELVIKESPKESTLDNAKILENNNSRIRKLENACRLGISDCYSHNSSSCIWKWPLRIFVLWLIFYGIGIVVKALCIYNNYSY